MGQKTSEALVIFSNVITMVALDVGVLEAELWKLGEVAWDSNCEKTHLSVAHNPVAHFGEHHVPMQIHRQLSQRESNTEKFKYL